MDNTRIFAIASAALANALGTDISDLPLAAAAPEWYFEKAITIGCYAVASEVTTFLGPMPLITGSDRIVELTTKGLDEVVGAHFVVGEPR